MKFKLDENFGARTPRLFTVAGHDVQTVRGQGLQGSTGHHIFDVCRAEQRCLVTLDLDFSDVTRFPPRQSSGVVVIRVPHNPSLTLLENLVRQFLNAANATPLDKNLWIVEIGRIRIHQREDTE